MASRVGAGRLYTRGTITASARAEARGQSTARVPSWFCCLLAALAVMSASTWLHSRSIEVGYRAQSAEAELRDVEEGNSQLRARLESLRDFRRVEMWARASGMVMREHVDHVALQVDDSPASPVIAQAPSKDLGVDLLASSGRYGHKGSR